MKKIIDHIYSAIIDNENYIIFILTLIAGLGLAAAVLAGAKYMTLGYVFV